MKFFLLLVISVYLTTCIFAQCDVEERVMPDGGMFYYPATIQFYKTNSFELSGNVITDKENYFLRLKPYPFDKAKKKIKNDLQVKLSNDTTYTLIAYDAWFNEKDSSYTLLYLFKKNNLTAFLHNKIMEVYMNMDDTSVKTYIFKLHPDAVQLQLACFIEKKTVF